mmetsp:Transcript_42828/g.121037  ORF Transcript_42828/g.121037 Transcript_42828/m.121037 type:complete len:268 (+) Transcript_42828:280-1083(+)
MERDARELLVFLHAPVAGFLADLQLEGVGDRWEPRRPRGLVVAGRRLVDGHPQGRRLHDRVGRASRGRGASEGLAGEGRGGHRRAASGHTQLDGAPRQGIGRRCSSWGRLGQVGAGGRHEAARASRGRRRRRAGHRTADAAARRRHGADAARQPRPPPRRRLPGPLSGRPRPPAALDPGRRPARAAAPGVGPGHPRRTSLRWRRRRLPAEVRSDRPRQRRARARPPPRPGHPPGLPRLRLPGRRNGRQEHGPGRHVHHVSGRRSCLR